LTKIDLDVLVYRLNVSQVIVQRLQMTPNCRMIYTIISFMEGG
jgi:hypothetical protein